MRVSLLWLKDYVELPEPPEEVAALLTRLGLVVDAVEGEGDDCVFEVDVTTNRPDCLSHIGIARELACATGRPLAFPGLDYPEADGEPVGEVAKVEVEAPDLCPRYTVRVVKGLRIGESPDWMKKRLELAGLRPINNVVDVTNFVLLEFGQPLHAFDLELVTDNTIIVRRGRPDEPVVLLDGTTHKLNEDTIVIADPREAVALGGVMGGGNTEINSQTVDVLLESALFERTCIRRTARRLGCPTESSYRFERGVDPVGVDLASRRAIKLILETAGGKALKGVVDSNPDVFEAVEIDLAMEEVKRVLGVEVQAGEATGILERLGLEITGETPAAVVVKAPSWRGDLYRPVDLIEEIARVRGYDSIPTEVGLKVMPVEKKRPDRLLGLVRETFLAAGYDEVVTDSFISAAERGFFAQGEALKVTNPVRQGQDLLRTGLVPSLLAVVSRSRSAGIEGAKVFECGTVYVPVRPDALPDERRILAAADSGGLASLRGTFDAILEGMGTGAFEWRLEEVSGCETGQSLALYRGDSREGILGIASGEVARFYDLPEGTAVLECRLQALIDSYNESRFEGLPRFPSVERDVAVVVAGDQAWLTVGKAIEKHAPAELEGFRFVEVYRGEQVERGRKSFLFAMTYRHPERTLTDEEVNAVHQRFLDGFLKEVKGTLRA